MHKEIENNYKRESVEQFLKREVSETVGRSMDARSGRKMYVKDDYREINTTGIQNLEEYFEKRYRIIDGVLGMYRQGMFNQYLNEIDPNHSNYTARQDLVNSNLTNRTKILDEIVNLTFKKQEEEKDNEIYFKFDALAEKLLIPGTWQHKTEKKMFYRIDDEKQIKSFYGEFINQGFSHMVRNHDFPNPDNLDRGYPLPERLEYRKGTPDKIAFVLQEHKYEGESAKYNRKKIELEFIYEYKGEHDTVQVGLYPDEFRASSMVDSLSYLATGYEGHDLFWVPVFASEWKKLYGLIEEYAVNPIKPRTLDEIMQEFLVTKTSTGKQYEYNPQTGDWDKEVR